MGKPYPKINSICEPFSDDVGGAGYGLIIQPILAKLLQNKFNKMTIFTPIYLNINTTLSQTLGQVLGIKRYFPFLRGLFYSVIMFRQFWLFLNVKLRIEIKGIKFCRYI